MSQWLYVHTRPLQSLSFRLNSSLGWADVIGCSRRRGSAGGDCLQGMSIPYISWQVHWLYKSQEQHYSGAACKVMCIVVVEAATHSAVPRAYNKNTLWL